MKKTREKVAKPAAEKKAFNVQAMFNNENYGNGLRCVIICALAVLLVVGVNLLSTALPTAASHIDVSTQKIHSISDDTKALVAGLEEDIRVLYVCEEGEEDTNTTLVLNLYADQSEHLTVEQVDPAFNPALIEQYTGKVSIDNNTVIVLSEDRQQVLDYGDYFKGNIFVLEDYMNSALEFVTSDILDKIYTLSGHGETALSKGVTAYMGLDGFETEDLRLLETKAVPEDAMAVLIYAPTRDLTETEADILTDYLADGGKLLLVTGYTENSMPNLETVTDYFAASLEKGMIMESDQNRMAEGNSSFILPYVMLEGNKVLTDGVEYVMMPNSKGIVLPKKQRDTVKTSVIMQTAETAGSIYTNIFTGQQDVIEGPFNLAVSFEEENEDGSQTRMLWFSSAYIADENISNYVGGGNITMFLNAVSWVAEDEPVSSIHGKTISTQFLTLSDSVVDIWKIVMIGAVPLAVLLVGVIVYIRRKRR